MFQKIIDFFKKHKFFSVIILIILAGGGYFWYQKAHSAAAVTQYVTAAVERGSLDSTVNGSGQVSALNQLDIKPGGSAAVTQVDVKLGQVVKAGQRIAVLDEKDAAVALAQAQATLASAKANYDSVVAGSTNIDIQLAKSAVDSAQLSLTKAKNDFATIKQQQVQAVANAYLNLLNASLQAQTSSANIGTETLTVTGSYVGSEKGQYNIAVYSTGDGFHYNVTGLENSSFGPIVKGIAEPLGLNGLFITFSTTGTLTNGDSWTVLVPNTQGSGYSAANNANQTAILTQQQALNNAQNSIDSAQISLTTAQNQLQQKLNGSTQAQIEQAKAQMQNAQSQLQSAQNNYNNNIITAPFAGVIASLNAKVGQQVSGSASAAGSTALATLITQQKIVVISLNEVDVSKIKLADKATLTFDAIDGLVITGTVGEIDQLGTVSQGVVNYNVQIFLDTGDDRIKTGMSATANIITGIKTDVLLVPNTAIKSNAGGSYVQELDKTGKPFNVPVATGIANDASTEIVSGVNEGDLVVTQTISAAASAASPAAAGALRIPGLTGGFGGGARAGGGAGRGN